MIQKEKKLIDFSNSYLKLLTKLDELFEYDRKENFEKKIIGKLDFDSFLEMNSNSSEMWYQSKTIEDITTNLYSIDTDQIIDLRGPFFIQF